MTFKVSNLNMIFTNEWSLPMTKVQNANRNVSGVANIDIVAPKTKNMMSKDILMLKKKCVIKVRYLFLRLEVGHKNHFFCAIEFKSLFRFDFGFNGMKWLDFG